jgi:hypothetical protein
VVDEETRLYNLFSRRVTSLQTRSPLSLCAYCSIPSLSTPTREHSVIASRYRSKHFCASKSDANEKCCAYIAYLEI